MCNTLLKKLYKNINRSPSFKLICEVHFRGKNMDWEKAIFGIILGILVINQDPWFMILFKKLSQFWGKLAWPQCRHQRVWGLKTKPAVISIFCLIFKLAAPLKFSWTSSWLIIIYIDISNIWYCIDFYPGYKIIC